MEHDVRVGRGDVLSLFASVLAAYSCVRIRYRGAGWVGAAIFLAYLVPPSILFIPLATIIQAYGLFDSPIALILAYPTILIPFSTWLLMGYFKTIPYELEECALMDGASRWQILTKIILPLAIPRLISAGIFSLTLCWNEFHLRADLPVLDTEQDDPIAESANSWMATSTNGDHRWRARCSARCRW